VSSRRTASAFVLLFGALIGFLVVALSSQPAPRAIEVYERYLHQLESVTTLRQQSRVITSEVATAKVQSDRRETVILDLRNGIRAFQEGDSKPLSGFVGTLDMLSADAPRPRVERMREEQVEGKKVFVLHLAFDDFYQTREVLRIDPATYRAVSASMTMEVPAPDGRMMHIAFEFAYSDYGIPTPGRP
jgi:hypothetical protein